MLVYRIAKSRYINDLSGVGAKLNGGRWNRKGISIIYTSLNRALASVEYLIHVPIYLLPKNLSIAAIEIPDNITSEKIEVTDLPGNWRQYPAPLKLAEIGDNWVLKNSSLFLRIPSAVVEQEYNILINPAHPDIRKVKIESVHPFVFDERLFKSD